MARMYAEFLVAGSQPDPYTVSFRFDGKTLSTECTCKAGLVGQSCKHRLGILSGTTTGIVSDNRSDVSNVVSWVRGTPLEAALRELVDASDDHKRATGRLSKARKAVAAAMRG